jgi:uncharacterized protein YjbI with pentapeptide repeats
MTFRAAEPPRAPALDDDLPALTVAVLEHEDAFDGVSIERAALAGQRASGVTFKSSRLADVQLAGSHLESLALTEVVVERCDLSNVEARRAGIRVASLAGCRMTGVAMTDATLRDVTIRNAQLDLASFAGSRLTRVTFENCVMRQGDVMDAELQSVRFHACDMTEFDLRGARLARCELRNCRLDGLRGADRLRGAAMPWSDIVAMAGFWAAELGIETLGDE